MLLGRGCGTGQSVGLDRDEDPGVGSMSPHLYKERKGGPGTVTKKAMRLVRFAATWGAALGIGIAVVMLSLSEIQTFSDTVTVMIMVATVSLCPTLFLTLHIKSKILVFIITIIGNGVLYGISGAIIGLGFALFRRATARNRSEEGESAKHRKTRS